MKFIYTLLAVMFTAHFAQAQAIGPAGCGLGNMVFGKDMQILAATTNGSSGSQTFGITTGTSNCGSGAMNAQLETFIEVNQVALTNDVARGQGETIASLSQILGCQNSAKLAEALKANYQNVFTSPDASATEISNGVQSVILKDAQLSQSCGNV